MIDQPTAETGAEAATSIEDALSNTMSSTFDNIMARDDEAETTEGHDTGETAAEGAADVAETETPPEGDETPDQGNQQAIETEKPLDAPASWSAEDKAKFAALPREAQEVVARRESERDQFLTQKSQEIAHQKREYDALDGVISPERKQAWMATRGFTPAQAIGFMIAKSDQIFAHPEDFILELAAERGIDLQELAAGGREPPNPQLTALQQTVEQLKQSDQQRQQQAQDQARLQVKTAVEEFAADTKAHPYYKDVESDIAAMIPGIRQQNPSASNKELLQIAYDKATWANEGVRSKILANQERLKNLEAANAAKKAKAAAGANVKTSGSASDGKVARTIDETMSETFDRIAARA